jgi:hypothetical protein
LLAALAGRIYHDAPQQNAVPLANNHEQQLRYTIASSVALLIGCAPAKGSPAAGPANPDSVIAVVERDMPHFRQDTATRFGLSAEGASLTASYDGQQLRRLRAQYLGETGRSTESFYFDSALVSVLTRTERYDRPMSRRVVDSAVRRIDIATVAPGTRDSLHMRVDTLLAYLKRP